MTQLVPDSKLYNDIGVLRTSSLFKETSTNPDQVVFTLNPRDKEGYSEICLRKVFLEYVVEDPTEVSFAEAVFGDVRAWMKISKSPFMKKYLKEWRETADVKRKSLAFKTIIEETKSGKSAFSAAKYLVSETYNLDKTKAEKDKTTAKARAEVDADVDYDRLQELGLFE